MRHADVAAGGGDGIPRRRLVAFVAEVEHVDTEREEQEKQEHNDRNDNPQDQSEVAVAVC